MVAFGDVSALVVDIGERWIRVGYSGEEAPRAVLSSRIGIVESSTPRPNSGDAIRLGNNSSTLYYVGDSNISRPRSSMTVHALISDNVIRSIGWMEAVFIYVFKTCLKVNVKEYAVLVSVPHFLERDSVLLVTRLLFESFGAPALYLVSGAVLAGFSQGKSTCLVVDIGESQTSVVPVVDGYAISSGSIGQGIGGRVLTEHAIAILEGSLDVVIRPHYMIHSKTSVGLREPPCFVPEALPDGITAEFHHYMKCRVAEDFKEAACQLSESSFDDADLSSRPARYYEFPDGYNMPVLAERYLIPEILFNPRQHLIPGIGGIPESKVDGLLGLSEMVKASLENVDADIRQILFGNILLCGGSSSISGMYTRLLKELGTFIPHNRLKIHISSNTYERTYASWIGGSILSSIKSFQSMWISKQEYDTNGAKFVEARCFI